MAQETAHCNPGGMVLHTIEPTLTAQILDRGPTGSDAQLRRRLPHAPINTRNTRLHTTPITASNKGKLLKPLRAISASGRAVSILLALLTIATGCSQGTGPRGPGEPGQPARTTPKRIVSAIQGDPHTVYQKLNPASRVRGIDAVEQLVAAGLGGADPNGIVKPVLAEAVPSTDNGLWKVLPDGKMEVTWKIKPSAVWQDGTPLTADDIVFTYQVTNDREIPIFSEDPYQWVESVTAVDPHTVLIKWTQPFIEADTIFASRALPFPRHLLETAYKENKATFIDQPYWSMEFIGAGPYKIKTWERGSHLIVQAFDQFALGRPKVDEVEVRFIEDANTLMANVLAGTVELSLGRGLSGPQALQVQQQWRDGRVEVSYDNWLALYPQFINPTPAAVANLQFRRAALHAMDRQTLVDILLPGQSAVADSWVYPNQPQYKQFEDRDLTRYPYDPRKATELLDGLGMTKGSDGIYQNAGQPLSVELRTTAGDDLREKMIFTISEDWKKAGVLSTINIVPRQLADDLEYRATFPSFELVRNPNDIRGTRSLHSRNTALPENNFRVTGNRSRYQNAELDRLVDQYFVTIPLQERTNIMGAIIKHMSENIPIMGVIYNSSPTLLGNRLMNITAGGGGATQAWNSNEWDIK
jgi:peptide/nickel transport system substrate-binding protein